MTQALDRGDRLGDVERGDMAVEPAVRVFAVSSRPPYPISATLRSASRP
jgi:hypothetical protein